MNTVVAQRLWKWKLVAGLLTAIVGVMVLAWPGLRSSSFRPCLASTR
jgi:hypothetical protein